VETGLSRIVTVDIASLPVGACRYGFMLNDTGTIIDDLLIYRLENDGWMVVVNAATVQRDAGHIKSRLTEGVVLENASERMAKLDLQGPLSVKVLEKIIGPEIAGLAYYGFGYFKVWNERLLVSRTGYTGERGYEIYLPRERAVDAWEQLLDSADVQPAGLGARDTLRLEMGYALYGQDIDQSKTPLEAGLERFVCFDKDFIGKPALLEQKEQGIRQRLVCFAAHSRRAPRRGYRIHTPDHRDIGVVTSGSFSPSLERGIGMGYVDRLLDAGSAILVNDGTRDIEAVVVEKPFYRKGTAR
ncbi:MAG: glycine cleavage system aminomethyltransferase GcvT, partial [Candidatus Omnitrophica bacterium]|nr:glycine cleavage system aminomethyltransferase GcvT [Candidatus Omnitrophota bacterium]